MQVGVVGGASVAGDLSVPDEARGLVVFAHGSGSSRHSPRNRSVAAGLHGRGLATLLMDLLTPEEEAVDARTREHRFDIQLLADRLAGAVQWLSRFPQVAGLPVGYFGASTGAAAALVAAAWRPDAVAAVVSRGGRPDLAGDALGNVRAPTLLLVGSLDPVVLRLNREAGERMSAHRRLEVVPGAGHLFDEPGTMQMVTRRAGDWFSEHLSAGPVVAGDGRV